MVLPASCRKWVRDYHLISEHFNIIFISQNIRMVIMYKRYVWKSWINPAVAMAWEFIWVERLVCEQVSSGSVIHLWREISKIELLLCDSCGWRVGICHWSKCELYCCEATFLLGQVGHDGNEGHLFEVTFHWLTNFKGAITSPQIYLGSAL